MWSRLSSSLVLAPIVVDSVCCCVGAGIGAATRGQNPGGGPLMPGGPAGIGCWWLLARAGGPADFADCCCSGFDSASLALPSDLGLIADNNNLLACNERCAGCGAWFEWIVGSTEPIY